MIDYTKKEAAGQRIAFDTDSYNAMNSLLQSLLQQLTTISSQMSALGERAVRMEVQLENCLKLEAAIDAQQDRVLVLADKVAVIVSDQQNRNAVLEARITAAETKMSDGLKIVSWVTGAIAVLFVAMIARFIGLQK